MERRPRPTVVRVRRTGGIAGRTLEGSVDLSADDPRAGFGPRLVDRLDLSRPIESETFPDAFSYTFEVGGRSVTVPQQRLSDDQRALADLLLSAPEPTVRQGAVEGGGHVQGRARVDREIAVGLLDQQLELGAAEQHATGAGVPELLDHAEHASPGRVDDPAVHQLVVDRAVEHLVVARVGDDGLEAVPRQPVGEEAVRHRDRGADEPDLGHPLRPHLLGDHVPEVQQRDVDGGLHLVGHLVERRRAQQQEVRAGPLDTAGRVGEELTDLLPALLVLERGHLGEVDGAEHELGRRESAEAVAARRG